MLYKYSGPPGTGKSTTLLNVVDSLIGRGTDPEDIVYTTFSRAGAYEARDRAISRFNLSVNRLPYFKTLHALCYSLLPRQNIMHFTDWASICKTLGLPRMLLKSGEDSPYYGQTRGERLLGIWSLSRMRLQPLADTFQEAEKHYSGPHRISLQELEHFVATTNGHKQASGKIDFTDMLEKWLTEGLDVHAANIIVDEAQDLSALQWRVVDKLCAGARNVWVAGDDDQCIHEWNGAAPRHFINLEASHYEVLAQSHRIPASVHSLAEKIIAQVKTRLPKTYRPREDAGRVIRLADTGSLNLRSGSWLLLARNKTYLRDYVELCHRKGVRFMLDGVEEETVAQALSAIATWKELQRLTQDVTAARAKHLYKFMSRRDRVANGFKQHLDTLGDELPVTYTKLVSDYGLLADKALHWWEALDMLPEKLVPYLKELERSGESATPAPRIRISTIHGAKGAEADSVVLRPDMLSVSYDSYVKDPDNEHRVWYVGVTRARKDLYLLNATEATAYPL